jgi:hypothetical protein
MRNSQMRDDAAVRAPIWPEAWEALDKRIGQSDEGLRRIWTEIGSDREPSDLRQREFERLYDSERTLCFVKHIGGDLVGRHEGE